MPTRRCLRSPFQGGIGVATRIVTAGVWLTVLSVVLSGCAYSRWYYARIDRPIRHDTWELRYFFYNAHPEDDTRDTVYYSCALEEADTARNRRLDFFVDSVRAAYGESGWLTLLQTREWTDRTCDRRVNQGKEFGPMRIPKPRPDTIYVDQVVTVRYRDTGETLARFHYSVKGVLKRIRYWYLQEFLIAD
jgi:hypothetical protein